MFTPLIESALFKESALLKVRPAGSRRVSVNTIWSAQYAPVEPVLPVGDAERLKLMDLSAKSFVSIRVSDVVLSSVQSNFEIALIELEFDCWVRGFTTFTVAVVPFSVIPLANLPLS